MADVHAAVVDRLKAVPRPDIAKIERLAARYRASLVLSRLSIAAVVLMALVMARDALHPVTSTTDISVQSTQHAQDPQAPPADPVAGAEPLDDGVIVGSLPADYRLVLDQRMNDPDHSSFSRQLTFSLGGVPLNHPNVEVMVVYVEQRSGRIERAIDATADASVPSGNVRIRAGGTVVETDLSPSMTVGVAATGLEVPVQVKVLESVTVDVPDCVNDYAAEDCGPDHSATSPMDGGFDDEFGPVTATTRPASGNP